MRERWERQVGGRGEGTGVRDRCEGQVGGAGVRDRWEAEEKGQV